MYVDGALHDLSDEIELDEGRHYSLEALIDRFVVRHARRQDRKRDMRDDIEGQVVTAVQQGLRVGEGFLRFRIADAGVSPGNVAAFFRDFACAEHHTTMGELLPYYFSFNDPDSACRSLRRPGYLLQGPSAPAGAVRGAQHQRRGVRAGCVHLQQRFVVDQA